MEKTPEDENTAPGAKEATAPGAVETAKAGITEERSAVIKFGGVWERFIVEDCLLVPME